MKLNKLFLGLLISGALFTSCSSDDDGPMEPPVTAPATYKFERNGTTTVSYGGQTTRIKMAEEIIKALKDPSFTEVQIDGMFNNEGDHFSDPALNSETSKVVRKKTAASFDFFSANSTDANAIKEDFDDWIKEQVDEVYPRWGENAEAGKSGQIQEAGGGSTRYVNAKGLELNQAFNKSLIGGMMVDQILNNYISSNVLANFEQANDDETLVSGKNYTDMEHDWDEAFGYLYGTDDAENPALNKDSFLNKYLSRVEGDPDFAGIAQTIYDAYKLGRAAIVAKNYTVRNEQAEILRREISKIIGVRAVYYLQQGKANLGTDNGSAFHDLSEGFGFIYSLQFTRKPGTDSPYFTKSQVDAYIAQLMEGNGFWDVSAQTLDTISEEIATAFGFTVEQAGS